MRDKGTFSSATYASREKEVKLRGSATYEGEERVRQGKGLDPLVDPKGLEKYGPMRGSGNLLVPDGDQFVLKFGVAMPSQTDCDLTGSMGDNVNTFFRVQPKLQKLLNDRKTGVLRRYQTQMCTGAIQDKVDQFAYQRSQFEPDNEVERQMGLLYPEKGGGDGTEDYQLSMFAAAYLTDAIITKYGLRGYYQMVGDADSRTTFDRKLLERVFGSKVIDIALNGSSKMPTMDEVLKKLSSDWHHFYYNVGGSRYNRDFWKEILGNDRIIDIRTEDLAEVQAVVCGLTEGVLDLQSAVDFLTEVGGVNAQSAKRIVESCSNIPIGLQKTFANFDKIPMAGARFASRDDIWPIGTKGVKAASSDAKSAKGKKSAPAKYKKEKKDKSWKV
jgi:hypothetical protein